ncbi:MAG: RHS repeat-associated core domain-containing protein [Polyangiaceae bacterium]
MERDASGRVIADIQRGRPIRYEYDRSSRRATRTLPDGGATRYFYDAAGGLTAIEHQGYRVALQHDAAGREIRRHVYGAAIDICRAIDPGARWLDQWVTSRPDAAREPTHLARRRYTYDPGQRPLECVDGRWGREAYAYDPAGHLLGVEGKNAVRFDYDASGALVGMHPAVAPATSTWKTRAGNVLVRSAEASFTYDDARRRRRKIPDRGKPTEYQWDARSRLREVRLPSGTRVLFWYDAFGRRVRKLVAPAGPSIEELATGAAPPVARVVDYLWDGQVLAAELDSVRGARVFIHHPTTGVPLCQIEDGEAYTYVTDPMGVPRELIDTRGRIAWAGSISPFGLVRDVYRDPGTAEISPPFRQLGHYADEDTGLLYTLFRWFDPETARWLSIDPLLLLAGGNLFGLEASPTFTVDVLGLGTGFPVGVYSDSMPRLEKHEPLQATWGAGRFLGPRGTWPFQSENPVIGLGVGRHDDVHEGADDIFKARHGIAPEDISTLSAQQVLKAQEEAMLAAGVPKDKVDAVIAAAKKHAPKFICK